MPTQNSGFASWSVEGTNPSGSAYGGNPVMMGVDGGGGTVTTLTPAMLSGGIGSSAPATGQIALSTTAAQLLPANSSRVSATICNLDASIVIFFGGSGVTTSTGQRLVAGQSHDVKTKAAVYAIAVSGTPTGAYVDYS